MKFGKAFAIFANIDSPDYTDEEIEEFRDVMMTVPADELGLWARCIGMRHLMLPEAVRDELLLRMRENDASTASQS